MSEAHLELTRHRCPRCAAEMVLRVLSEERGSAVELTLDTACVCCGTSPWDSADQRTVIFLPGAPGAPPAADLAGVLAGAAPAESSSSLAAAQARIEGLLRRCDSLENELAAARRDLERAAEGERRRRGEREESLRAELTRLEGALAASRAEVRRSEEATRGEVLPGKRAIEIE